VKIIRIESIDINNRREPAKAVLINADAITFVERRETSELKYSVIHFGAHDTIYVTDDLEQLEGRLSR
jgi:hypothetical protein